MSGPLFVTTGRPMSRALADAIDALAAQRGRPLAEVFDAMAATTGTPGMGPLWAALATELRLSTMRTDDAIREAEFALSADLPDAPLPQADGPAWWPDDV